MVHSESKKCKKCPKLCNPNMSIPLFTATCSQKSWAHHDIFVDHHNTDFLWTRWAAYDCSSCQFLNHFTKYPCFKVDTSTFIRDLCTLCTKLGISKEGGLLPKTEIPQEQFWCHDLYRKNPHSSCLLRWTTWPTASLNHCPGIGLLCQPRDASCFILQYQQ